MWEHNERYKYIQIKLLNANLTKEPKGGIAKGRCRKLEERNIAG